MTERPPTMPPPQGRIHDSITELVGRTPIVRLSRLAAEHGIEAELLAKLEFQNPLGSVKDRIGLAMIDAAEAAGTIARGRSVLVEPTSGNTGIALAFVAAARGYRLIVTMPDGASVERRKLMRLLGAEVELTPAAKGMEGAIARAEAILAETPDAWMPRQFDNPANPAIHEATTAEEIWSDCGGRLDVVVGGAGTGGTLTGIARRLKPRLPALRLVLVEPAESAVLSGDEPGPHGIQGLGPGFKPAVLELEWMDAVRTVTEREALALARQVARVEGIPVGISAGAALAAAIAEARGLAAGARVLVIVPSFAERYISTALFAGL
jgi:cysteine synthase